MSFFKLGMDRIQEFLIFALMLVFVLAVLYSNIGITYKIGIGALIFGVVFAASLATQALKQEEDQQKKSSQ
jgi:hypothetical protein